MNDIIEIPQSHAPEHDVRTARKIGTWLRELGSYLPHPIEFRKKDEAFRKEFFAEMVQALLEEDFPREIWEGTAARRFIRKNCEFFPSLKTLIDLLKEHSLPIREAYREQAREAAKKNVINGSEYNLPPMDASWLRLHREYENDSFKKLAEERGTNPEEARYSSLSLLRQMAPAAYDTLTDVEKQAC